MNYHLGASYENADGTWSKVSLTLEDDDLVAAGEEHGIPFHALKAVAKSIFAAGVADQMAAADLMLRGAVRPEVAQGMIQTGLSKIDRARQSVRGELDG